MRVFTVMAIAFLSAACVSPEQQFNMDKSQCEKFGYKVGSDKYSDCLKDIHLQRNDLDQREESHMMNYMK